MDVVTTRNSYLLAASASIALALAATALAQDTAPKIKVGWWFDLYQQYDFGKPGTGDFLNGRGIDIANKRHELAFAQFEVSQDREPWGFNLQLYGGRGPEIIHLAEPGGKTFTQGVRQAYVTYASKGSNPVTIDFGKFDTWIGYEGIDTRSQDQYSRSLNWTLVEPTYHTGLRASAKLSDAVTGTVYVVQGWNEVEDSNDSKSYGLNLAFAASPKTTVTLANHFGKEGSNDANDVGTFGGIGFANAGESDVHIFDFIVSHQIDEKSKIAFNADFASSKDAPNKGDWSGQAVYYRQQIDTNNAWALRFERVHDADGLRTGAETTLHSMTGTFDHSVNDNLTLRFELRGDRADRAFFNSESGLKKNRATLTAAAVVKF